MSAPARARFVLPIPAPLTEKIEWQLQSSCRGLISDEDFFPDRVTGSKFGKRICNGPDPANRPELGCPVRMECLLYALETGEERGTWGGMDEWERARLQGRKHRR